MQIVFVGGKGGEFLDHCFLTKGPKKDLHMLCRLYL